MNCLFQMPPLNMEGERQCEHHIGYDYVAYLPGAGALVGDIDLAGSRHMKNI